MSETWPCFMVEEFGDLWIEDDGNNVGAMIRYSHGVKPHDTDPRPMPHLFVMTPAGVICLDCPASDPPHGKWTVSGEPPNVTVTPSLNINREEWHGWLTEGHLRR